LTEAQKLAGFKLNKCICETYGVPKRAGDASGGIIGHKDINPVDRSRCPGAFPWQECFDYLNSGGDQSIMIDLSNSTVASHFTGDNNQWTCKETKFNLHGEILAFYKGYGGTALCGLTHLGLPLSNEISVPNRPGIVYQAFERGVLIFDPSHIIDNPPGSGRVYLLHIDKGLGMDPRVAKLQAENANLKEQLDTNTQAQQIISLEAKIALAVKDLQL
jgi:hypothetical protein